MSNRLGEFGKIVKKYKNMKLAGRMWVKWLKDTQTD